MVEVEVEVEVRRRKESESVERSIISFFFTFFLKLLELVLLGDDERRRLLLLLLEGHSSLLKLRRSKNRRRWNDREKRKSTGAMNFSESQRADFFPFLSLSHFSSLHLSGVFLTALSLFTTNASVVLSLEQLSLSAPPPRTRLVERASEREEIDRGENKDFFFSLSFSLFLRRRKKTNGTRQPAPRFLPKV